MKSGGQIIHGDGCLDFEDAMNAFLEIMELEIAKHERAKTGLQQVKEKDAETWKEGSMEYHKYAISVLRQIKVVGFGMFCQRLQRTLDERKGLTVPKE